MLHLKICQVFLMFIFSFFISIKFPMLVYSFLRCQKVKNNQHGYLQNVNWRVFLFVCLIIPSRPLFIHAQKYAMPEQELCTCVYACCVFCMLLIIWPAYLLCSFSTYSAIKLNFLAFSRLTSNVFLFSVAAVNGLFCLLSLHSFSIVFCFFCRNGESDQVWVKAALLISVSEKLCTKSSRAATVFFAAILYFQCNYKVFQCWLFSFVWLC